MILFGSDKAKPWKARRSSPLHRPNKPVLKLNPNIKANNFEWHHVHSFQRMLPLSAAGYLTTATSCQALNFLQKALGSCNKACASILKASDARRWSSVYCTRLVMDYRRLQIAVDKQKCTVDRLPITVDGLSITVDGHEWQMHESKFTSTSFSTVYTHTSPSKMNIRPLQTNIRPPQMNMLFSKCRRK